MSTHTVGRTPRRVEQLLLAELPQLKRIYPGSTIVVHYITERLTARGPEAQLEIEFRLQGKVYFQRVFL